MGKTIKDSELLSAMIAHLDDDIMTYGAKGGFSVGAYYGILGENYNKEEIINEASATTAAEIFRTDNGTLDEGLQAANWLKEL